MNPGNRQRLDQRLVSDGLAPTRSRARDLILRGFVRVDGELCAKPAQTVAPQMEIVLAETAPRYVSRGAEKLSAALDHFGFEADGQVALDIGSSTGGFTQVLLERGAQKVYAVDVGTAQLHEKLRADPRVVVLENCDARTLSRDRVSGDVKVIVADVSFISQTKALPGALALAVAGAFLVALIKPQFELEPDDVGKGGIVRDEAAHQRAIGRVRSFMEGEGWSVVGVMPSPILGGSGNQEFLIGAVKND